MYVLAMLKETEIYVNHPKREDPLPEKKKKTKNKTKQKNSTMNTKTTFQLYLAYV